MYSGADPVAARAALTGAARRTLLAVSALHSDAVRNSAHGSQIHGAIEQMLAGFDAETRSAGLDPDVCRETKYALVALADDLALHSDWDHAETWGRYLLELAHFNTSFAGAEFFERLNKLRQRLAGVQDPALRAQLLGSLDVYLACLRMGFRGRLRGAAPAEAEQLMAGISSVLYPPGENGLKSGVWPEAYAGAGQGAIHRRGRWWWWPVPTAFAAMIALWFLFSVSQDKKVGKIVERVAQGRTAPQGEGR